MKKKYLYYLFFLLFFVSLIAVFSFGLFFAEDPKIIPSVLINKAAPNFSVITFDNQKIILEELKGKPVVLNFFASWCVPCWAESVELESVWQQYKDKSYFIGLAVNDSTDAAIKFVKETGVSFYTSKDNLAGTISLDYGVTGIPETFFIDSKGIIKNKFLGAITRDKIEMLLKKL